VKKAPRLFEALKRVISRGWGGWTKGRELTGLLLFFLHYTVNAGIFK
jgi:hypothetical protein